ncbi:isochorismatase hydrolase [Arthrobacter crystallopoietes BAB-32]|uniref:Isochorismatase hydrolase n=1 Tax=Arthrobacter crystallopoietes BAB-32 TaxID=1246476 RepID=N1V144_9MICC|nr:isochorismatase family cysteine hydrolase [Arthrobacter crystallopoietes]EMY35060.1 isochorismatase hydrolase [Arthrobacter crystallopoietes BAB-32]
MIAVHGQGDIIGAEGAFADFFHEQVVSRDVVGKVAGLLESARGAGATVVYTRIAFEPDYSNLVANSPLLKMVLQRENLKDGARLTEIIDPLAPTADDVVITHQRVGGFVGELTDVLEQRGIDTVLFAGVATNVSVESSARAASDLGYRVVIVEDACSTATPEAHEASINSLGLLADITVSKDITWTVAEQPA